jgi:hypothetical protein
LPWRGSKLQQIREPIGFRSLLNKSKFGGLGRAFKSSSKKNGNRAGSRARLSAKFRKLFSALRTKLRTGEEANNMGVGGLNLWDIGRADRTGCHTQSFLFPGSLNIFPEIKEFKRQLRVLSKQIRCSVP